MSQYEMRPFRIVGRGEDGRDAVEECIPGAADGWAVYERTEEGPAMWVSDHASRRGAAVRIAELRSEAGEL